MNLLGQLRANGTRDVLLCLSVVVGWLVMPVLGLSNAGSAGLQSPIAEAAFGLGVLCTLAVMLSAARVVRLRRLRPLAAPRASDVAAIAAESMAITLLGMLAGALLDRRWMTDAMLPPIRVAGLIEALLTTLGLTGLVELSLDL